MSIWDGAKSSFSGGSMFGLDGLLSGVFGFLGQEDTNDANVQQALQTSAFNASQADINRGFQSDQALRAMQFGGDQAQSNRDFQAYMSNSAWQRATADMEAAGLNPMLAYSQGGASSPSGSAASGSQGGGSQASGVQAFLGNRAQAALNGAQAVAQVEKTQAETENIKADTKLTGAKEVLTVSQQNQIMAYLNDKLPYEIGKLVSEIVRTTKDVDLIDQKIKNLGTEQELTAADVFLAKMQFHKALNNAQAADTAWGRNVAPFLDDAGKVVNSASRVFGRGRSGLGLRD